MFFIVAQSCRKRKGALLLFADDPCKICVEVRKKPPGSCEPGGKRQTFENDLTRGLRFSLYDAS